MKRLRPIIISFTFIVASNNSFGQDLEVISGGGTYTENPNGSIAWTIGEPVIDTYEGTSNHLTQGFHQPDVYVLSTENFVEIELSIYPNPTSDYINVVTDRPLQLRMFDESGKLVQQIDLVNNNDQINVSGLSRGTYVLNFLSSEGMVKSMKILKL